MPIQLSITVHDDLVRQGLEDLEGEIPKVGRLRIYKMMRRIKSRASKAPPKYRGPGYYKNAEHRRKVLAMIHMGIIQVPYKRTGRYKRSFRIDRKGENGYMLRNLADYANWVGGSAYGTSQARIHQGRWPLIRRVTDEEIEKLPKEVADDIVIVARRKGFVAQ